MGPIDNIERHDMQNLMRYLCNCPIATTLQMQRYYNTNGWLLPIALPPPQQCTLAALPTRLPQLQHIVLDYCLSALTCTLYVDPVRLEVLPQDIISWILPLNWCLRLRLPYYHHVYLSPGDPGGCTVVRNCGEHKSSRLNECYGRQHTRTNHMTKSR